MSPSTTWATLLPRLRPVIYRARRALIASDHLARSVAFGAKRWWHHASVTVHRVLTKAHVVQLGVPRLAPYRARLEPPDADPHVRPVVWEGPKGRYLD